MEGKRPRYLGSLEKTGATVDCDKNEFRLSSSMLLICNSSSMLLICREAYREFSCNQTQYISRCLSSAKEPLLPVCGALLRKETVCVNIS